MGTHAGAGTALPTFVIAGVQKCGTTSLFQALARHPQVVRPQQKELHFFDQHWGRGINWYRRQFPALNPGQITGESTPVYSYDPVARRRMSRTLPDARVIVVLRDPVSRAYSHYWHSRRNQEDLTTFEEALAAEPDRLAYGDPVQARRFSYVDRGRYIRQLKSLGDKYGDALLVTSLEALTDSPETELPRVMRHLGLDPAQAGDAVMPTANRHRTVSRREERELHSSNTPTRWIRRMLGRDYVVRDRERPTMDSATREHLRGEFAEPDRRLLEWLGWDALPWGSLANPVALPPTKIDLTNDSRATSSSGARSGE